MVIVFWSYFATQETVLQVSITCDRIEPFSLICNFQRFESSVRKFYSFTKNIVFNHIVPKKSFNIA